MAANEYEDLNINDIQSNENVKSDKPLGREVSIDNKAQFKSDIDLHNEKCKCVCDVGCLHDLPPFEIKCVKKEILEKLKDSQCQSKCETCTKMKEFFSVLFKKTKK